MALTVVPVLASWPIRRGVHHQPWLVGGCAAIRPPARPLAHARLYVIGALLALHRCRRRLPVPRQELHADHG